MGSGSSKAKNNSEVQLRSRPRQPDFEEEILDSPQPDRVATSRPVRRSTSITSNTGDDYFSKFHKNRPSANDGSKGKGRTDPITELWVKDPEVEEAIAELEETFRVLDGNSTSNLAETSVKGSNSQFRSQSSGPLTVNNNVDTEGDEYPLQQQNHPRFVPNKGGTVSKPSQNGRVVENGRRQYQRGELQSGHGIQGQSHLNGRKLHPPGLNHLPRGQAISNTDGGANSAPPGVSIPRDRSDSEDWNYELPKIEGFDIEKFREVNGQKHSPPISISLRLPSDEDGDYIGSRPKAKGPSYTKDEMELFNKLEREVY